MPPNAHGPVISVMLAVPDARAAAEWYAKGLGAAELWNLGSVVGLMVEGAPLFLGQPANNGWDTPTACGTRTVRVEVFVDDPESVDFVPEPDALDPDVSAKRRERRRGERAAGVEHLTPRRTHPVPLEARRDAVGIGELDDHRAVPIPPRRDDEVNIAVVLDLRFDHLGSHVVTASLDPPLTRCGRVETRWWRESPEP